MLLNSNENVNNVVKNMFFFCLRQFWAIICYRYRIKSLPHGIVGKLRQAYLSNIVLELTSLRSVSSGTGLPRRSFSPRLPPYHWATNRAPICTGCVVTVFTRLTLPQGGACACVYIRITIFQHMPPCDKVSPVNIANGRQLNSGI